MNKLHEIFHNVKYDEIITKIHSEFNNAGNKLYEESLNIINNHPTKIDKINKLKKFGFIATKEVVDYKSIELSIELVALIKNYKLKYPLYKFITEDQVQQICSKYNLVLGKISQYTGFVPNKNLNEIERFKIDKEDILDIETETGMFFSSSLVNHDYFLDGNWQYITFTNGKVNLNTPGYTPEEYEKFRFIKDGVELRICAPAKDFNIKLDETIKDYKIVVIPDPVVLYPVKGGYFIITAWGPEASDKDVVNEINN